MTLTPGWKHLCVFHRVCLVSAEVLSWLLHAVTQASGRLWMRRQLIKRVFWLKDLHRRDDVRSAFVQWFFSFRAEGTLSRCRSTDFYCSFIHVVCSRIGVFFSYTRVNQNAVYCQAACVFDVKRGERSASVPMETVCARWSPARCCIETEKLKSKVDALNDNAVILSKSLLFLPLHHLLLFVSTSPACTTNRTTMFLFAVLPSSSHRDCRAVQRRREVHDHCHQASHFMGSSGVQSCLFEVNEELDIIWL